MTTVTRQDFRALRYCSRGAREFFARHGLDWSAFLAAGIPAEALEATGDAMAKAAAEEARRREANT